jgi:transcriptional regulator with XRE-family HTH domain
MTDEAVELERIAAQERLILEATEAITALLLEQGLSRKDLAARLGRTKGFVSHLLSGERNMTLRTLSDLAFVLGRRFRLDADEPAVMGSAGGAPHAPSRVFVRQGGPRHRTATSGGRIVPRADAVRREDIMEQLHGHIGDGPEADSHESALAA